LFERVEDLSRLCPCPRLELSEADDSLLHDTSNICANVLGTSKQLRYKSNVRSIERQFDAFPRGVEMSAITVFVPQAHHSVDLPWSHPTSARPRTMINMAPATADAKSSGSAAAADWRLTDRGIAVVFVIAAMILTAAIAVIGTTAVRVTSPGSDTGLHESRQAQH
jgi:hypothetical protein